jgi:ATP-dependent DNA ligase
MCGLSPGAARDWTREFEPVANAVAAASARNLILDGEVVVFDRHLVRLQDGRQHMSVVDPARL